MPHRFRLESLQIKGFRGFPEQAGWQNLRLNSPSTVVYGIQGGGKSSTLHSIAWCLFGKQVASKSSTGIQERKSWLILNQHSNVASVELVLRSEDEELKVVRSTKAQDNTPAFYVESSKTGTSTDEEALWQHLGIEMADYMSCVHLHQELVSGLMLQDPQDRKNSFERLLGLADLRNFFLGLKKARTRPVLKDVDKQMALVTQKLETHRDVRTMDLEQAQREARRLGWSRVEEEEVVRRCMALLDGLRQYGPLPEMMEKRLQPKFLSTARGLIRFLEAARNALRWIREQQPLVQKERGIRAGKELWLELQKKLALMEQFVGSLDTELSDFRTEHGTREHLQEQLDASTASNEESLLRLLEASIQHLSHTSGPANALCPLCQSPSWEPEETLAQLQERLAQLQKAQPTATPENTPQQLLEMLKGLEDKWERTCRRVIHGLHEAREQMQKLVPNLPGGELREELQHYTADFVPTQIQQQPQSFIRGYMERVERVLAQHDVWLQEVQGQSGETQQQFRQWEEDLEALQQARVVLDLAEEVDDLQNLHASEDIQEARVHINTLQTYVEHIGHISTITEQLLQELAQQKLGAAREAISSYYRQLSGRADFPDIVIDVEKFEVLAAHDESYEVALRFFNKGDINCAALSIFLALASSSLLEHKLNFILLDDPSQHMDTLHKQKLADVLAQIQQERQIVLATAEPDFLQMLETTLPTPPTVYKIKEWDPAKGPTWDPPL
ncbi:MAG: hypothetical protein EP343_04945 [Deltaproteobacteria bacterium]|nr:MAG: hypothetical protein EP343_04945 [Deltaproteobacteria bacterium]